MDRGAQAAGRPGLGGATPAGPQQPAGAGGAERAAGGIRSRAAPRAPGRSWASPEEADDELWAGIRGRRAVRRAVRERRVVVGRATAGARPARTTRPRATTRSCEMDAQPARIARRRRANGRVPRGGEGPARSSSASDGDAASGAAPTGGRRVARRAARGAARRASAARLGGLVAAARRRASASGDGSASPGGGTVRAEEHPLGRRPAPDGGLPGRVRRRGRSRRRLPLRRRAPRAWRAAVRGQPPRCVRRRHARPVRQEHGTPPAAALFFTSRVERAMWRYREPALGPGDAGRRRPRRDGLPAASRGRSGLRCLRAPGDAATAEVAELRAGRSASPSRRSTSATLGAVSADEALTTSPLLFALPRPRRAACRGGRPQRQALPAGRGRGRPRSSRPSWSPARSARPQPTASAPEELEAAREAGLLVSVEAEAEQARPAGSEAAGRAPALPALQPDGHPYRVRDEMGRCPGARPPRRGATQVDAYRRRGRAARAAAAGVRRARGARPARASGDRGAPVRPHRAALGARLCVRRRRQRRGDGRRAQRATRGRCARWRPIAPGGDPLRQLNSFYSWAHLFVVVQERARGSRRAPTSTTGASTG